MARTKAAKNVGWWDRDSAGWNVVSFVLAGAVTAGLGAVATYWATQQANTEMVFEQKRVSELTEFQTSAKILDGSIGAFSDSLTTSDGVFAAKSQLRAAVRQHSTDTVALRNAFGAADSEAYLDQLLAIQRFTDEASKIEDAAAVWQTTGNMVSMRKKLVERAEEWSKAS